MEPEDKINESIRSTRPKNLSSGSSDCSAIVVLTIYFRNAIASKNVEMPILPIGSEVYPADWSEPLKIDRYRWDPDDGTLCFLEGLFHVSIDEDIDGETYRESLASEGWRIDS